MGPGPPNEPSEAGAGAPSAPPRCLSKKFSKYTYRRPKSSVCIHVNIRIEGALLMSTAAAGDPRGHLYRLLADPVRLRVLALSEEAELSVGELAEVLEQTQPNVSRQ